jgi:hypothetical protein
VKTEGESQKVEKSKSEGLAGRPETKLPDHLFDEVRRIK